MTMSSFLVTTLLAVVTSRAPAQEAAQSSKPRIAVPPSWGKAERLPEGFEVGFGKKLSNDKHASLLLHHEILPPEVEAAQSNNADLSRQWDSLVRSKYPDARSVPGGDEPKVTGKLLFNGTYDLVDSGETLRRRYTYFLSGRTAFLVHCSAPPEDWDAVVPECDSILASVKAGDVPSANEKDSDEYAKANLQNRVTVFLHSFPPEWACSLTDVSIARPAGPAKRTLELTITFQRKDIKGIYGATKFIFAKMKTGEDTSDASVPSELKPGAAGVGDFMKYVGQLWGLAWGYVANCDPPIELFKIAVKDSSGNPIGAVSISHEDGAAILSGKLTPDDAARIAGMYAFE
jgi:hypothetical protein